MNPNRPSADPPKIWATDPNRDRIHIQNLTRIHFTIGSRVTGRGAQNRTRPAPCKVKKKKEPDIKIKRRKPPFPDKSHVRVHLNPNTLSVREMSMGGEPQPPGGFLPFREATLLQRGTPEPFFLSHSPLPLSSSTLSRFLSDHQPPASLTLHSALGFSLSCSALSDDLARNRRSTDVEKLRSPAAYVACDLPATFSPVRARVTSPPPSLPLFPTAPPNDVPPLVPFHSHIRR
jgi:hypothetical protein